MTQPQMNHSEKHKDISLSTTTTTTDLITRGRDFRYDFLAQKYLFSFFWLYVNVSAYVSFICDYDA